MNNEKAIIDGVEYHFIELLPSLGTQRRCVLCADSQGSRFVCTEECWRQQILQPKQDSGINTNSTSQEKIALFLSLFRGREDVYDRQYYSLKSGKCGYVPLVKINGSQEFATRKRILRVYNILLIFNLP